MLPDELGFRTIAVSADGRAVEILDQTRLPHRVEMLRLESPEDAADAIREMRVRGAPLIGATAAYGVALAMRRDSSDAALAAACARLLATRPTAVNLRWALDRMRAALANRGSADRPTIALERAGEIAAQDAELCAAIGRHGLALIADIAATKPAGEPVNVLTHCNAGALATCGIGTATAPLYLAHREGIALHVWVDETRPRNQGAALTTWELGRAGVAHTLIADNAGGHLMQRGMVDLCIVGSDRTTAAGDVCNKIGTYLKALAARDTGVPFYAALPSTTIDWTIEDGVAEIPIEERSESEVAEVTGRLADGTIASVAIAPDRTPVSNQAFDVTPARLVTGIVTERGVVEASKQGLAALFPDLSVNPARPLRP